MKDSNYIHIGVYSAQPQQEPIDFTIKLTECSVESTYSPEVKKLHDLYKKATMCETDAQLVNKEECNRRELSFISDYTFGEVIFANFIAILDYVKPQAGEIFYDLGCANGLPSLIAALFYP